jgi:hypothetical protein
MEGPRRWCGVNENCFSTADKQVMIVASGVHGWTMYAPGLRKYPRSERLALEAGLLLTQPLGPPGLVRP